MQSICYQIIIGMIGSKSLFFEGSEKKVELFVSNSKMSLLGDIDEQFWHQLVECCNAKILSSMSNKNCKAFLLSESSLFVWHDRFVILTCGNTDLVKSIEFFVLQQGVESIAHLTYQRKNEYFAHAQPSCFADDIKLLSKYLKGEALRFGEMDGHHTYIFHQENQFKLKKNEHTYELLAYQISPNASEKLTSTELNASDIREFLQLDKLFPHFEIDDHVFKPYGYSVNAILDEKYVTIHVTPQADSSYVSFESNINLIVLAPVILSVLKPNTFDLLTFNENEFEALANRYIASNYISKSLVSQQLTNGDFVHFANYVLPQHKFSTAITLDIEGGQHTL